MSTPFENSSAKRAWSDSPEKLFADGVPVYPQHTIGPERTGIQ